MRTSMEKVQVEKKRPSKMVFQHLQEELQRTREGVMSEMREKPASRKVWLQEGEVNCRRCF